MPKEEMEAEADMEEVGRGRKYDGLFEKGGCTLKIKVDCWSK